MTENNLVTDLLDICDQVYHDEPNAIRIAHARDLAARECAEAVARGNMTVAQEAADAYLDLKGMI